MDKFKVSFADSNGRRAALELCCFCQNVTDLTQTPGEVVQAILSSAQTVDGWKILKTNNK